MNVEFACVKGADFPTPFGLLVFSQNGSECSAICVADVPARCVLAGFAVTRVTAFAQDVVLCLCVRSLESDAQVLEGGACVEAALCHAEAPQGIRSGGRVGLEEPLCRFVRAHADRDWLLLAMPRQPLQKLLLVEGISASAAARFQAR